MQKRISVRMRLVLSFALILCIPTMIIGTFSYLSASSIVKKQIEQQSVISISALNEQIDALIKSSQENVTFLSKYITMNDEIVGNGSPTQAVLDKFQQSHSGSINTYLGSKDGRFFQSPVLERPEGYDPTTRDWYIAAMERRGETIIIPPYIDAGNDTMVVTVSRALEDGSGVVALDINLESIIRIAENTKIGQAGYPVIIDAQKRYISHPTITAGTESSNELGTLLFENEQGKLTYDNQGDSTEVIFGTNEKTGWKIAGLFVSSEFGEAASPIFTTTFIVIVASIVVGSLALFFIIRSITKPLHQLVKTSEAISKGDLTESLQITTNDEIGEVGNSFNQMSRSLRTLLQDVKEMTIALTSSSQELADAAEQSAEASQQTAENIQLLAEGVEVQVNSIQEADQTVRDLISGVNRITESSKLISQSASESSEIAAEGNKALQIVEEQMNRINNSVTNLGNSMVGLQSNISNIDDIVKSISDIAAQTNLLALNASIEAARAGEHGRGFAVVASEVSKLADESSSMANKIAETIAIIQNEVYQTASNTEKSVEDVNQGITVIQDAGVAFHRIENSVQSVGTHIQNAISITQEVIIGIREMSLNMDKVKHITELAADGTQSVSATTEEQLASMEEISTSAESLSQMAERLQSQIIKFKL
ncbi:methyl-accepting chemotaxis protein [Brevibacillus daliensis]|uniref:methyl-accepting chemotaxis protein n=1 Tax=Brevibacillus daliensis TaxID=2892995 RepID=UPI001E39F22E|nr:methyl-accepting chemotaxis protein [Brevibacillus daliensis]